MTKLTVLYGHPADPAAFEKYYLGTHLPLAGKIQGIRRTEFTKVSGAADGGKPAFYRIAELWFDSPEHMQKVMSTPEAAATLADIPNFATGGVTTLVSQES
ncbi:MAG: EthD family reductase [Burkholderiaceae bacterium]